MRAPRDPAVQLEASDEVLDLDRWVPTYVEALLALDEPAAGGPA